MSKIKATKKASPYGPVKFNTVEAYHNSFPEEIKAVLHEIHSIISKAAPAGTWEISYNMPAIRVNKILVYYAAGKNHMGFYPTPGPIKVMEAELVNYKTSKGAIQFPYGQKLPVTLIKKIVKMRLAEEKLNAINKIK